MAESLVLYIYKLVLASFIILYNDPTDAQLIDKLLLLLLLLLLYCCYMFRHYCVILREPVVSTYTCVCVCVYIYIYIKVK